MARRWGELSSVAGGARIVVLSAYFDRRGVRQAESPDGASFALCFTSSVTEHLATRRGVGIFDFSFMGWWEITGRQARGCLERLQTRDLAGLEPGKLCYTLLCREDGSVFIDATVWCLGAERYWLFTGRRSDFTHLQACASLFDVEVVALADAYAVIAVQGPASAALLERALPGSAADSLRYFAFRHHAIDGLDAWIGRLGYTGEVGYEILVPCRMSVRVWSRLVEVPFAAERLECGMEAANSLRIEAGFIHFAYELRQRVWPVELGLARLVRAARADFIGGPALQEDAHAKRRIRGVALHPPPGSGEEGIQAGGLRETVHLSSEAFSPSFQRTLGLAFLAPRVGPGVVATDDGRVGELVDLPFYPRPAAVA